MANDARGHVPDPPPTWEEVDALRREVARLQARLQDVEAREAKWLAARDEPRPAVLRV